MSTQYTSGCWGWSYTHTCSEDLFLIIVLNVIERMKKKIILILKNARFSDKGCQSLLIIINVTRIRKKLISHVKLDHTFLSTVAENQQYYRESYTVRFYYSHMLHSLVFELILHAC